MFIGYCKYIRKGIELNSSNLFITNYDKVYKNIYNDNNF